MAGRRRGRTNLGVIVAGLVLTGCGGTEPEPLEPVTPAVPADLCAYVPEQDRVGLIESHSVDESGDPTAACSLRSEPGGRPDIRAVLTWTQLNDEDRAAGVLESQCRSIDQREYVPLADFEVNGGDDACAGKGRGVDSATIAVLSGREVLTVRLASRTAGEQDAVTRASGIAHGVIDALADN